MNPAALFAAHKTAILGTAAAGVVGLALLNKRKAAAGGRSATPGATIPGTIPAAAVTASGGAYDSTSYDLYNALQPELEQLRQTVGHSTPDIPAPNFANGFYAMAGGPRGEAVYQYKDGLLDLVPNGTALHQMGGNSQNIHYVTKNDAIWSQPRAGKKA